MYILLSYERKKFQCKIYRQKIDSSNNEKEACLAIYRMRARFKVQHMSRITNKHQLLLDIDEN